MKTITSVSLCLILVLMMGCSSTPVSDQNHTGLYYYEDGPTTADKQKLWDAMVSVLGRDFVIRESLFREGVIVAVSRMNHHGGRKTRAKLTAKIIQDEEGYFQPLIRITDEVDISTPRPMNPTGSQPQYEWVRVRNNPNLEAQLVNEINRVAYGQKGFEADFFVGPVKSKKKKSYQQPPRTEKIYERTREFVTEERMERSPEQNSSSFDASPRSDHIYEAEFEKIQDPELDSESSNAWESESLSGEKEKSALSK